MSEDNNLQRQGEGEEARAEEKQRKSNRQEGEDDETSTFFISHSIN